MMIQKISQNLRNSKLISLYNNLPFIIKCFHDKQHAQWHEKHCESSEPESCQTDKMLFFHILLLLLHLQTG